MLTSKLVLLLLSAPKMMKVNIINSIFLVLGDFKKFSVPPLWCFFSGPLFCLPPVPNTLPIPFISCECPIRNGAKLPPLWECFAWELTMELFNLIKMCDTTSAALTWIKQKVFVGWGQRSEMENCGRKIFWRFLRAKGSAESYEI